MATSNWPSSNSARHLGADGVGVGEGEPLDRAEVDNFEDLLGVEPAKRVKALLADAEDLDVLALGQEPRRMVAGKPGDRRIEGAAQPALGGADDEEMGLVPPGPGEQPRRVVLALHRSGEVRQHRVHPRRIGARRLGRGLRAAQLRRRDHLHGLGDLLRRLDRGDTGPERLE